MSVLKKYTINLFMVMVSIMIPLLLAEYFFKKALFNKENKKMNKYRVHSLYADEWDENFWKLYRIFTDGEVIGRNPLIGWTYPFYFNRNFFHKEVSSLGHRRAALLYGDSFAQCVAGTEPFQNIINSDTAFIRNNWLINYGTGAFGVDQIFTLFKNSYYKYENPIVVFSFMSEDIDRSLLKMREGIKPYYTLQNDSLVLNEQPYVGNFKAFIKKYPPTIKSYLWRKFLYSNANFLPTRTTQLLTGETANRTKVISLNQQILQSAIDELRHTKTDFIFLVFNSMEDMLIPMEENWRMQFISEFVKDNKIDAIYTKDLLSLSQRSDSTKLYEWFLKNDGHPNTEFNRVISNKIKHAILNQQYERNADAQRNQYQYTYTHMYDSVVSLIHNDNGFIKAAEQNSIRDKVHIDTAIKELAMWMFWDKFEK